MKLAIENLAADSSLEQSTIRVAWDVLKTLGCDDAIFNGTQVKAIYEKIKPISTDFVTRLQKGENILIDNRVFSMFILAIHGIERVTLNASLNSLLLTFIEFKRYNIKPTKIQNTHLMIAVLTYISVPDAHTKTKMSYLKNCKMSNLEDKFTVIMPQLDVNVLEIYLQHYGKYSTLQIFNNKLNIKTRYKIFINSL